MALIDLDVYSKGVEELKIFKFFNTNSLTRVFENSSNDFICVPVVDELLPL